MRTRDLRRDVVDTLATSMAVGGLVVCATWLALTAQGSLTAAPARIAEHGPSLVALVGWCAAGRVGRSAGVKGRITALVGTLSAVLWSFAAAFALGLPAAGLWPYAPVVAGASAFAGTLDPSAWCAHRRLPGARLSRFIVGGVVVALLWQDPAGAWIASARMVAPTETQTRTNGVDLAIDTHQWFATQAIAVLAGDGRTSIVAFLNSPDPSAPFVNGGEATTPVHETYRWRLLLGARDADGVLYRQIPDHFHNWWTHRGRQWIVGSSAATNAERAFKTAMTAWQANDRATAVYWLGAAVHLLGDSCVPQHQFFAANPFHHDYELWVQQHQDDLAVSGGGIYRNDFRADDGHGGAGWSSAHPRGWIDECAHRAAHNLQAATHATPAVGRVSDPQWRTAPHIADTQRLTAGFIAFFFDTAGMK